MTVTSSVSTIALRTFPIFQGLGDDRLAAVARCAMMRRVPRGSAVVHEGDRTDFVYFVLTGNLKVMVSDEDGREVILTILGQGEMFGEMGVLDDSPRSASVVAVSPADLVTIAKTDFKRLMQENFELSWHVMCNLTRRLRDAGAPQVMVSGNLKFDMTPPPRLTAQGLQWRQDLRRTVVLAVSTCTGLAAPSRTGPTAMLPPAAVLSRL